MKMSTFHCALHYVLLYTAILPMLVGEVLARYPLPDGNQLGFEHPPRTGLGRVVDDYNAGGIPQSNLLIKYGNITDWDMSQVTNLNYIFADESTNGMLGANANFNGDVSYWNTSGVTTMIGTFSGASSFNIDLSRWETGAVTHVHGMFKGTKSFNGDISTWKTGSIVNMKSLFGISSSSSSGVVSGFNGDISKWDTRRVKDMSHSKCTPSKQNILEPI